jgi:CBS domain-containing protein
MGSERLVAEPSLLVHTRRVLSGEGDKSVASTVACVPKGEEVPLAACLSCEHSKGVSATLDGRRTFLRCQAAKPAERSLGSQGARRALDALPSAADRTPVSEVMTANVLCVREDVSVATLMATLLERGISGVPVVDASGFPVGLVSKTDLVRDHHENGDTAESSPLVVRTRSGAAYALGRGFHEGFAQKTVAEIMTPVAFTLGERAPVSQAAALMAFEGVHRVPVVSADGRVVGILSALDVLRWLAQHDGYLAPRSP